MIKGKVGQVICLDLNSAIASRLLFKIESSFLVSAEAFEMSAPDSFFQLLEQDPAVRFDTQF
jgi:hypothetical protein